MQRDRKNSSFTGSSPSPKVATAIRDEWNKRHQIGDKITYIDDNANPVRTTITAQCEIVAGCRCAKVAAAPQWCCLDRLITV